MSDLVTVLRALPRIREACRGRELHEVVSGTELSEHQARILSALDDVDPTMVTELAEHMGVTASTMSLNLKRLEAAGFVSRHRDPADRRVMNVRLTEAGRRVRDATWTLSPERVAALLDLIGEADRRRALDGLVILARAADRLMARAAEHAEALTGV